MTNLSKQFSDSLSVNQKASLKAFVKLFVKKNIDLEPKVVFKKIIEEFRYDFQLKYSRYVWLKNFIEEDIFKSYLFNLINKQMQYEKYKKIQTANKEKIKEFNKKYRQKAKIFRQSHEKPTVKQLKYYNFLCEKYKIEKVSLQDKSKLDIMNLISEIVEKHGKNEKLQS